MIYQHPLAYLLGLARALRPGGHLVIVDSRMDYPLVVAMPDGSYGYLPHHSRMTSEYLTAALPLGFEVRHCEKLHAAPARCSPAGPVRVGVPLETRACDTPSAIASSAWVNPASVRISASWWPRIGQVPGEALVCQRDRLTVPAVPVPRVACRSHGWQVAGG